VEQDRVDEHLPCKSEPAIGAGAKGDGGREIPARARPADGETATVEVQGVHVLREPRRRRETVLVGDREPVLGREPVATVAVVEAWSKALVPVAEYPAVSVGPPPSSWLTARARRERSLETSLSVGRNRSRRCPARR
jgi:hypothetical protein